MIDDAALDTLFFDARSQNGWREGAVDDDQLRRMYEIAKMGPTASDTDFHLKLPRTFPHKPEAKNGFEGDANAAKRQTYCLRNGSLSGAYLILAARAVGLDAGPMSGFDNAVVDAEFFKGTSWRSNFLCAIGHGDPAKVKERLPRLPFEETCRIL
jgi:3-hydroxypropanoate dehydrogenase